MDRIRTAFQRSKVLRSHDKTTHVVNAQSSILNSVAGDQYNVNITHLHPTPLAPLVSSSGASPTGQAPFNDAPIDNLSIHFTGRKRELALIAKAFERRRDIPLRCALHGNQGVGKSQLTYLWAKSTFARKENAYIMWISATTVEKLFQGFCRLLRFVNHPHQSHPDQNARLEAARRWLEEIDTGNWLLVFDNVFPETVDFLREHLPRTNGRGTILFTTRTRDVAIAVTSTAGERHDVIEVPLLDLKEGVELFCGHFEAGKVDPSSAQVEAIVKAVGCLPLAISHAAAYMDQSKSSLDNMLALYQSKHKIDVISWQHTLSDYEHKSVAATFTSQLHDLDQHCPDASKLLRVMAFLDPESIPLEILITGAKAIDDTKLPTTRSPLKTSLLALIQSPVACQNAVTHLQSHCLVAYHTGSHSPTFRIHDLVQLVILENTKSSGLNQDLFELAVELVGAAFRQIRDPWSWPRYELLIPHIQSLTTRQDTSSKAKAILLQANHGRALYLDRRGRYVEAENLFENIITDRQQLFNLDDLDTLAVMHDLAVVYQRRGRYVDAETLLNRVLKVYKTQYGSEHRHTLRTMYQLARISFDRRQHDDAETLLKPTLQSQESQFGSEDGDTLNTMNLLAGVYVLQGRCSEADSLLTRVLQTQETLRRPEQFDTLNPKHILASVYLSQRRYDDAAVSLQQVLCALKKLFGSQHPETAMIMWSLARVHTAQGRYSDAEQLLVHALAAREQTLGLSHPDTLQTIKSLASVYKRMGRLDESRMLKQRISTSS